jgi:hypothetical protein
LELRISQKFPKFLASPSLQNFYLANFVTSEGIINFNFII